MQTVQNGTPAEKAGIHGGRPATEDGHGRARRRHHRLGRRQSGRELRRSRQRHPGEEAGRHGHDRSAAGERQRRLGTQDRVRDARRPSELGAQPEHAPGLDAEPRYRWGMSETSPKVKICGITSLDDAELAVELGAWAIGMVFYEGSPAPARSSRRCASRPRCAGGCELCGVFVNASPGGAGADQRGSGADAGAAARRRGPGVLCARCGAGPARA